MTVPQNPRLLCYCADHKSVCRWISSSGLLLLHFSLDCHDTIPGLTHSLSTVCPAKRDAKGHTAYSLRSVHLVKYALRSKGH